jgi:hypothetical protein
LDIDQFLRHEGIKPFSDPRSYWSWATRILGQKMGRQLADSMEERAKGEIKNAQAFYDLVALPQVAPVAASFEYELLVKISSWVLNQLPYRGTIIELGCQSGLLTRFYAQTRPDLSFIGIDRSEMAIQAAQKKAQDQKIKNLSFITADLLQEDWPEIEKADCVISGRVIGELMSLVLRRRVSWQDYRFPPIESDLDKQAREALQNIHRLFNLAGSLLMTERLTTFDRMNRLWITLQESGYKPEVKTINPIFWRDVSGEHNTWFFQASTETEEKGRPLEVKELPWVHKETTTQTGTTRLMLDGILAWQTWWSLSERKVRLEETLRWQNGEEVHYEIGETGEGLHYAYIASNTDVHLLTIYLLQDDKAVIGDMVEYVSKLKASGARSE